MSKAANVGNCRKASGDGFHLNLVFIFTKNFVHQQLHGRVEVGE
jgi:hypothetical protein